MLPTAQKAEDRYKNGRRSQTSSTYFGDSVSVRGVTGQSAWYQKPPIILEKIRHDRVDPAYNDTTYAEQPAYTFPVRPEVRAAGNNVLLRGKKKRFSLFGDFYNNNYNQSTPEEQAEYDTLKKRFNTAWGVAKHEEGSKIQRIPFNLDPKITYKTPEFVPTYNKTVPEVNVISAKLPGIEVTAPDLSKTLRFPYGGINVVSKSINGGLDRKQRTFVNPFEGHDLVASKQDGGLIERSDNTRVASGRPQQVLNKIPYGAGKGPAGEGPMRLFNDPYVNMGLMAMAPMAVKIQSRNVLVPAQRMESLPVSTTQNYGLLRLYRAAQLKGYKGTIEDFIALSSEILGTPQAMGPEGNKFLGYNLERGNNVLYSRPNPENPKVEGLTVNEPARWQELLKKIIK